MFLLAILIQSSDVYWNCEKASLSNSVTLYARLVYLFDSAVFEKGIVKNGLYVTRTFYFLLLSRDVRIELSKSGDTLSETLF